jgi:hypothetical protein
MRNCLLAILIILVSLPCVSMAQVSGSFIAGLELGITSAVGDFRDTLDANTGFGLGAELRYALINGLSIGPMIRYNRFGTNTQSSEGSISFNYTQYGAIAQLNLISVDKGNLYLAGGGGIFTPNSHLWAPDFTEDVSFESGQFFTVGAGLTSDPKATTLFALEVRYNKGQADLKYLNLLEQEETETFYFDSIAIMVKIGFNSKGIKPQPRY